MDWIKRNYDQFILALVALGLLVLSGFLISSVIGFKQTFASIEELVPQNNHVPPSDMSGLENANRSLQNPSQWALKGEEQGSLFVSIPYVPVKNPDGTWSLEDPRTGPPLYPPVPNKWIIDHKLDILDTNVLNEDPSGDGFTNFDKWKGLNGHSYDPQDKNSHPPYWTKLRLAQFIKQPFRLELMAYTGDVKKPETLEFQINTLDVAQPSQFVKIGDMIAGTKFKIMGFQFKTVFNPKIQGDQDVSELTVQNQETQDNVVLVLEQVVDSPDSYALFRYLWNGTDIKVQKNRVFVLLPEKNIQYKLIDIQEDHALIQPPTGEPIKVPHLEQP
jgi:hypothetical protein